MLYDAFRERKLLDRYLETAALKNDLSLPDAKLLLALWELDFRPTRREAADFANLSRGTVSLSLQKLTGRGFIKITDIRSRGEQSKRMDVTFCEASKPILEDLEIARRDYESARLAALDPAELEQYSRLCEKVQNHIRDILQ